MKKICDDCGKDFDIFQEGHGHAFFVVCGDCWAQELKKREIGGVWVRE